MNNWEKRLERLDYWLEQDKKLQTANNNWCKVLFPDSFPPIFARSLAKAYINGLANGDKELKEWLEYIAYEVPMIKDYCDVKDVKGRKYNFKNRKEQIQFFNDNF